MTKCSYQLSYRLFETNFAGVIKFDHYGNVREANTVFLEMLGYNSMLELISDQGHPSPQHWQDIEREIIRDQVKVHSFSQKYNKEYYHEDGSLIYVEQMLWSTPGGQDDKVIWGLVKDLSKEKHMQDKLEALLYQVENTDRHRNEIIEKERKLISAEIHDSIGQQLTGIALELGTLKNRVIGDPRTQKQIEKIMGLTDESLQKVRNICTDLRSVGHITHNGIEAIRDYCATWQARTGIKTEINSDPEYLGEPLNSIFYRIVQEALANVSRHAKATGVRISIKQNARHITLCVHDNGVGIPPKALKNPKSLGLLGMKERAESAGGKLKITANHGTLVEVVFRLEEI